MGRPYFIAFMLLVASCASGSTKVATAPSKLYKSETIAFSRDKNDLLLVDDDVQNRFVQSLSKELYEKGRFKPGDGLKLVYRFVEFHKGNRAARYLAGPFGGGKARFEIEATFYDSKGGELSKVKSSSQLKIGFFGGSYGQAIDKMAMEIASFAASQYGEGGSS